MFIFIDLIMNTEISDEKYEKTFVFCLLNEHNISCNFMMVWTEIVGYCLMKKIKPLLTTIKSDNFVSRMNILNPSSEKNIPFQGANYDKIIFISTKTICNNFAAFEKLISSPEDVVSALTTNKMGLENTNYIEHMDLSDETKKSFDYALIESAKSKLKTLKETNESTLLKVDFVNISFLAINKGVFEKMGIPWFNYNPKTNDISGDVHFCNKCKENGIDIFVDLECYVTSEKNIIY